MRLELSIRSILVLAGLLIVIWLFTQVWSVILLIAVSVMLAAAFFPVVELMVRHRIPRGFAVAAVSLLLLGTMALIGFVLVPLFINQAQAIINDLPTIRGDVVDFLIRHHQPKLADKINNLDIGTLLQPQQLATTGRYVINVIYSTVTVLVLTVYFLLDARRAERFIFYITPDEYHAHIHQLFYELKRTVGGYVRGQIITSTMIGIYTLVVLEIVGIPNALALGVVAAIGDMIPMVGGLIAIVPASLFALTISLPQAIIVCICMVAYEEFESRVLVPRVYGGAMRLPAVVVFVALLMGAEVAGLIGALLAVPIAAVLRGLVAYAHDVHSGRLKPNEACVEDTDDDGGPESPSDEGREPVRSAVGDVESQPDEEEALLPSRGGESSRRTR